jgi:hypothetical protein
MTADLQLFASAIDENEIDVAVADHWLNGQGDGFSSPWREK